MRRRILTPAAAGVCVGTLGGRLVEVGVDWRTWGAFAVVAVWAFIVTVTR